MFLLDTDTPLKMAETTDPSGSYSSRGKPAFRDNTQLIAVIYWIKAKEMEGEASVHVNNNGCLLLDFARQALLDTLHVLKE